ncbi:hypothetical protein MW871_11310 [Flavobacterium sp. I-SCBP12n]|uniref:Uncharacterized protein n=1 Tax=Flavobacterium pygoscelis TaxID=2893176 RepID=A0A9X2BP07_9FLAO|nr:hypothetical protein [Flavobacterium pygoscelis]MCK8142480.1 hypothetical protein [Flavobacterium pygoscelis]
MAYQQYNKDGVEITPQDLQNKILWCKDGEKIEEAFVNKYGNKLGLIINPEKNTNPYAPDLLKDNTLIADLKTQNTPFFKAKDLYGIDPTYAVVFNRKDAERYWKHYKQIIIYFWVEWQSVKFVMGNTKKEVEFINGVWSINFLDLVELLKVAPEHIYQQRIDDKKGNAKGSFVLDIRNPSFSKVV